MKGVVIIACICLSVWKFLFISSLLSCRTPAESFRVCPLCVVCLFCSWCFDWFGIPIKMFCLPKEISVYIFLSVCFVQNQKHGTVFCSFRSKVFLWRFSPVDLVDLERFCSWFIMFAFCCGNICNTIELWSVRNFFCLWVTIKFQCVRIVELVRASAVVLILFVGCWM